MRTLSMVWSRSSRPDCCSRTRKSFSDSPGCDTISVEGLRYSVRAWLRYSHSRKSRPHAVKFAAFCRAGGNGSELRALRCRALSRRGLKVLVPQLEGGCLVPHRPSQLGGYLRGERDLALLGEVRLRLRIVQSGHGETAGFVQEVLRAAGRGTGGNERLRDGGAEDRPLPCPALPVPAGAGDAAAVATLPRCSRRAGTATEPGSSLQRIPSARGSGRASGGQRRYDAISQRLSNRTGASSWPSSAIAMTLLPSAEKLPGITPVELPARGCRGALQAVEHPCLSRSVCSLPINHVPALDRPL